MVRDKGRSWKLMAVGAGAFWLSGTMFTMLAVEDGWSTARTIAVVCFLIGAVGQTLGAVLAKRAADGGQE